MTQSNQMRVALSALLLTSPLLSTTAMANGVSENEAWSFQSTSEAANRAYIEEMRTKRVNGFFNSPQYNTYVDTQNNFNCSNSANSSGNGGTNSAVANTPNANGASGNANGNQNANSAGGIDEAFNPVLNADQKNLGPVIADVIGDTFSSASGNMTRQVLNTFQDNLGRQASTIVGSNACSFPGPAGGIFGQ